MKHTQLLLITIALLILLPLQAQDITNKLGGNDNTVTYDVTDSADKVLLRVQGDGKVGIGTTSSSGKLTVDSDGNTAIYGNQSSSTGSTYGVYGNSQAATGAGVKGTAGPTGANFGGHFTSSAMDGTGVYGSSNKYGGYFSSTAFPSGIGLYSEGSTYAGQFVGPVYANGSFSLTGTFLDKDGNAGTAGQILSSTATGTDWIDESNKRIAYQLISQPASASSISFTTVGYFVWDQTRYSGYENCTLVFYVDDGHDDNPIHVRIYNVSTATVLGDSGGLLDGIHTLTISLPTTDSLLELQIKKTDIVAAPSIFCAQLEFDN